MYTIYLQLLAGTLVLFLAKEYIIAHTNFSKKLMETLNDLKKYELLYERTDDVAFITVFTVSFINSKKMENISFIYLI